jgi:hypothetical protein
VDVGNEDQQRDRALVFGQAEFVEYSASVASANSQTCMFDGRCATADEDGHYCFAVAL